MPTLYNGIGTRYYGRKNLQTRPGTCEFCRRDSVLSSYDTRLWFVIFLIPVIPLGRKHVLNYCPKCTRHRVMSLAEWEKLKNQNLSEAMAGMAANPQDPKAAIKAHSALVAFHQIEEADKLTLLMKERFANDAPTQAYLGYALQHLGKYDESIAYYQRALTLDPELDEAKVAVALNLIKHNQLNEARKLLAFLEAPDQTDYSGALLALAYGYQRAARHAEALALFELLLQRFPKLSQDKNFRQAFKKSQAAVGAPTKLPPREIRWGPLIGLGSAIVLILGIALGSNYYISQHRTLYLVSSFAQPVTVRIPGHEKTVVTSHGLWTITLPEGKYQATLTGAVNETVDFTIASGFWARWFGKPLYILNAGGSALLYFENATYSVNPVGDAGGYSFHYGKSFITFPQVDYPFIPFPDRLDLGNHSSAVQKTHSEVFPGDPKDAFMILAGRNRLNDALDMAEWHLRVHPEATHALPYYSYCADVAGQQKRALAYFAEAVKRRPVELEWHRMYQESRIANNHDAPQVIAEYNALLQADPTNSALLYLVGRLQTSKRLAMPLYEKAIGQNPSNSFAHFALGQSFMDHAEWDKALPEVTKAARLQPGNNLFDEELFETRMALKDYDVLEKDLQAAMRANPLDLLSAGRLGDVFIAQGHTNDMDKLLAACQSNVRAKYPGDDEGVTENLRAHLLYSSGQFEELAKLGAKKSHPRDPTPDKFEVLVELGRLQDAAAALKARSGDKPDPFEVLAFSAACKMSGDEKVASLMRDQAITALATDRPENVIVAGWLKAGQAVPLEDVMDLSLVPDRKKVLLVTLAQSFPESSAPLLTAARQLNVNRSFPFHLINRLTDSPLVSNQTAK